MAENEGKSEVAKREEETLTFWKKNDIFKKTLAKPSPKGEFVFYEGPPTANGRPGIHHLETRAFKDAIPRFRTMQGYHVRRKAGWDTHGLPVELEVEKELGIKNKKDIEQYGIAKFNKKCKESVLRYIDEWKRFTDRIGFWVDHSDTYFTFDNDYIESVWAILAHAEKRELLYKDYKVVPWCPRCGTALSSHEVAQGYEDNVPDPSILVKFKVKNPEKIGLSGNVYLLAWTTTPWTLPGNVALAVGGDVEYINILIHSEQVLVAAERADAFGLRHEKLSKVFLGKDLLDLRYEPLFPYLTNSLPESEKPKLKKAYKVYVADFVSTNDGTGIVHTAVMYGADDFVLGTHVGLPKHHLVKEDGTFIDGAGMLAGKFVKDADKDIIADLEKRGLLLKSETIHHTYPFCWRCKKPLIYYARDSWYIAMSRLKSDLIRENQKIHWEPEHIRDGRFGEWLRELKDWAISRSRFWGTPLPIWEAKDGSRIVVESREELAARAKCSGNRYFLMRHGEAQKNLDDRFDCTGDPSNHLTDRGKVEVEKNLTVLKGRTSIDLIIASPLVRTEETARAAQRIFGLPDGAVITDERLKEVQVGEYNGKTIAEWRKFYASPVEKFSKAPVGGETYVEVRRRVGEVLLEAEKKYAGRTILFVMHDTPAWLMNHVASGRTLNELMHEEGMEDDFLAMGEARECVFTPAPRDENLEPDFHRPYIDDVVLTDGSGREYRRVPEVLDVWFDSGAMPLAEDHYPFDRTRVNPPRGWLGWFQKGRGYPADFICEAVDQTRGWFYTLHAVGGIMGIGHAFRNVICLGHVLDAKGKKMSKSLGNIVEPNSMLAKYGADALRYFMYTVNAPGDAKNFDERTVDEIVKKHTGRLGNVLSFYKLYEDGTTRDMASGHVLDRWILARLDELIAQTTAGYENYKIDAATRPLADFIDDLSTWYLRRSRERFKDDTSDKKAALATLRHVLYETSRIMAPSMPFFAEHLFQSVREEGDEESVHLAKWPEVGAGDKSILASMSEARQLVSLALEQRDNAGIKVRQPLGSFQLSAFSFQKFRSEFLQLVKEEINVKEIKADVSLKEGEVRLDTDITPELKEEGVVRDFVRSVQSARKDAGLHPNDKVRVTYDADAETARTIIKYEKHILASTNATELVREGIDGVRVERV